MSRSARRACSGPLCLTWLVVCGIGCAAEVPEARVQRLLEQPPPGLSSLEVEVRARYWTLTERGRRHFASNEHRDLGNTIGELAMWYETNGMEALSSYQLAHTLSPGEPRWLYHQARCLDRKREWTAAIQALTEYGASFGYYEPAALRLLELKILAGELDAAEDEMADIGSDHPRFHTIRAELAIARNDAPRAERLLRAILVETPDAKRVRRDLGLALRMQGKATEASRWLAAAGEVDKDEYAMNLEDPYYRELFATDPSSHRQATAGRHLFAEGEFDEAIIAFRRALRLAPDRAKYKVDLATALAQSHQDEEARDLLLEASRDPGVRSEARIKLATLESRQGRYQEAMALCHLLLDEDPFHQEAHRLLAQVLRHTGEDAAALEHYRRAGEVGVDDPSDHFWRVVILLRGDSPSSAHEELAEALSHHANDFWLRSADLRLSSATTRTPVAVDMQTLENAAALLKARPTVFAVETLAMTLAGQGLFQQAANTQSFVTRYLHENNADSQGSLAREERFNAGRPARYPLLEADLAKDRIAVHEADMTPILQGKPASKRAQ